MQNTIRTLILSTLLASSLYAVDCEQTYNVQSFAQRFYTTVLDRQPDNAGLDSWTNALTSRTKTGTDVANGFIFSDEFIAKDTSNEEFVTIMYRAFFNRPASGDVDGYNYWLGKLTAGEDRTFVSRGFLYSQEFAKLSESYGIQAYEGATFTTTALDNFVKRFYSVILGRDADEVGLKSWTDKLSTNDATGEDIAFGFIFSPEYDIASKTNTEYINTLYAAFFNREADEVGFNGWMTELNEGTSRKEVLNGFLHSKEFINLTNSFGILAFLGAPQSDPFDNTAPVANAGEDKSILFKDTVTFDASNSTDLDGTVECGWWVEENTLLSTDESFTKNDFDFGVHNIRLTVVDDSGVSNSTSIKIDVPSSVTHNGTSYGFVVSPYTGKVWLDRNLGAERVCTAFDDALCYGDYYQWGRNADGHEDSRSDTTTTLATNVDDVGYGEFISSSNNYPYDWASVDSDGSKRSVNWSKVDGSSICPIGFRVSNILELKAELFDVGSKAIQNNYDAYNSFLKLPSAGVRDDKGSYINDSGSWGFFWSSSIDNNWVSYATQIEFSSFASYASDYRALGASVRCIKN